MCWHYWCGLKSTWNSSSSSHIESCSSFFFSFILLKIFFFPFLKTQIKDSENTQNPKKTWFRERERESVCVCENPRWRSHPYGGGGWDLPLDRESRLKRREFWFGFREMNLRLDHHRWWWRWLEEEPRRLSHGSSVLAWSLHCLGLGFSLNCHLGSVRTVGVALLLLCV